MAQQLKITASFLVTCPYRLPRIKPVRNFLFQQLAVGTFHTTTAAPSLDTLTSFARLMSLTALLPYLEMAYRLSVV